MSYKAGRCGEPTKGGAGPPCQNGTGCTVAHTHSTVPPAPQSYSIGFGLDPDLDVTSSEGDDNRGVVISSLPTEELEIMVEWFRLADEWEEVYRTNNELEIDDLDDFMNASVELKEEKDGEKAVLAAVVAEAVEWVDAIVAEHDAKNAMFAKAVEFAELMTDSIMTSGCPPSLRHAEMWDVGLETEARMTRYRHEGLTMRVLQQELERRQ